MGLLSALHFKKNNDLDMHPHAGVALIRPAELLESFPGPAFIMDAGEGIVDSNLAAADLLSAIEERADGKFSKAIQTVLVTGKQGLHTFSFGVGDAVTVFDLTLLTVCTNEAQVLVTGKDVSMQRNLTNALVASRQLFKDLVNCTAEFVWETDEEGRFRYVSPKGAIGYTAIELDGRIARSLIIDYEKSTETTNPFDSTNPVNDQVIWLRDRSEALACMRISSIPVFDEAGNRTGCRGAGHDITGEMAQRSKLDKMATEEKVFSKIIDAIRHEIDPTRLFAIAGQGACDALNSTRMLLVRKKSSGSLEALFKAGVDEETEASFLNWMREDRDEQPNNLVELVIGNWRLFIAPINSGDQIDGAIVLVRSKEATELEDGETRLLRLLSEHLGVALIQIKAREKLEHLSRTDELSGLLNRRAFHEDVVKRLKTTQRSKVASALFYIDLDNFKPVNDRFGHEKGDEVLKGVSVLLANNSRVGDMVSRLGGDEFAMWLEDIPLDRTIEKAEQMQVLCKEMSIELQVLDPSLSFSIGIAISSGLDDETLESLLSRADSAMYDVKARGKGTYSVAEEMDKSGNDHA